MKLIQIVGAKIICLCFCLLPLQGFCWGQDGHKVVGEIAWQSLAPGVREKVGTLLKIAGEPSLAESATWADRIRSNSDYDWAAPLHYINLPKKWSAYDRTRDCPQQGCVVEAIARFEHILANSNAPESERAEALLFVTHFVGDLHQPMHTGLREDRGGNDIALEFFGFATNLHALWDTHLSAGFIGDWREYAGDQLERISDSERALWLNSDPATWAAESHRLAHDYAYTDAARLGVDYYQRNRDIAALRLRQGGVRLAGLLNRALATDQ